MWPENCEEKPSTLHVIQLTVCISDPIPRRLPISYGKEGSQMLSISESLKVLVSFSRIGRMWKNLTHEAMKEYLWDTPLQARFIGNTTKVIGQKRIDPL